MLEPQQLIILTRNYTWDETLVLGKAARRRSAAQGAGQTDLVGLLVQNITAASKPENCNCRAAAPDGP